MLTTTFNADQLIDDVMANYPEASCCITCVEYNYAACEYLFWDHEVTQDSQNTSLVPATIQDLNLRRSGLVRNAVTYRLGRNELRKGMEVLQSLIQAGKLKGLGQALAAWSEPGAWDMFCVDALVQCAIFGEVIYG